MKEYTRAKIMLVALEQTAAKYDRQSLEFQLAQAAIRSARNSVLCEGLRVGQPDEAREFVSECTTLAGLKRMARTVLELELDALRNAGAI